MKDMLRLSLKSFWSNKPTEKYICRSFSQNLTVWLFCFSLDYFLDHRRKRREDVESLGMIIPFSSISIMNIRYILVSSYPVVCRHNHFMSIYITFK